MRLRVLEFFFEQIGIHIRYDTNFLYHNRMITMYDQIPVINNETERSFEMIIDGKLAIVDYKKRGNKYLLVHTEVPREWQGHGIAAVLVEKTLHYLEDHHLKMIPYCDYIKGYLKKHPDWKRLLPE